MKPHQLFVFVFGALLSVIILEVAFYFFSVSKTNITQVPQCVYSALSPTPLKLNNEDVKQICQMFNSYKKTPNKLMKIVIENSGTISNFVFDSTKRAANFDLVDAKGDSVEKYRNVYENKYVSVFDKTSPEKKLSLRSLIQNEFITVRTTEEVLYGSLVPQSTYYMEITLSR